MSPFAEIDPVAERGPVPGSGPVDVLDPEAEAFLGGLWASAKSVWEQTLVKTAMSRGVRDEGRLTDLVFFRRHPDRSGRPLSRAEPGFADLADEWTGIRDTIVRPALQGDSRVGAVDPPAADGSTAPAIAPPSPVPRSSGDDSLWLNRRDTLVASTLAELSFWGNGELQETDQRGWERIERYWRESVGWTPSDARGRSLATDHAWSGVFISWVVARAGIGRDLWSPWSNHAGYLVKLLRMQAESGRHPIAVVPPYSVPLRPGDMINNWRDAAKAYDLDELRRWVPRSDLPSYPGHTDIVTEVQHGSHVVTVGGNKSGSVTRSNRAIDRSGVLVPRRDWVAVIRLGP